MPEKTTQRPSCIDEIISYAKQFPESAIFRGENSIYNELKPKIGRLFDLYQKRQKKSQVKDLLGSFINFENEVYMKFKRFCEPYIGFNPDEDEVKVRIIGQHYGLPTRLLDWTENILVATYFAVEYEAENDRRIYIYDTQSIIDDETKVFSDRIQRIHKYLPPIVHQRIISQSSLFTVHPKPYQDMRMLINKNQKFSGERLEEIIIPRQYVSRIRSELNRLGVNGKSIWPDIEGVIKYTQWFVLEKYSEP